MLKMTVKSGSGGDYTPGWKLVTVKTATYGTYENTRYVDMWFEEYGDNFNARIWEKKDKEGNEFAIANLFRFANAGITTVESNGTDTTKIVEIDDSAANLVGSSIHIYLYKNEEGYARVLQRIAPTVFRNELDNIDDNSVTYWKGKAEQYFTDWVEPNIATSSDTKTADSNDVFAGLPE